MVAIRQGSGRSHSTNKQATLDDYLARGAILGTDVRGGGMALMFAVEMMAREER